MAIVYNIRLGTVTEIARRTVGLLNALTHRALLLTISVDPHARQIPVAWGQRWVSVFSEAKGQAASVPLARVRVPPSMQLKRIVGIPQTVYVTTAA